MTRSSRLHTRRLHQMPRYVLGDLSTIFNPLIGLQGWAILIQDRKSVV